MSAMEAPTILVVDDDQDIREAMRDALELRAYRVVHAHDGKDALVALRSVHVDLIVLDLLMPEMDGWTFLERRAADGRASAIPVLVVTAIHDSAAERDARIERVLWKPFAMDELIVAVAQLAQRRP